MIYDIVRHVILLKGSPLSLRRRQDEYLMTYDLRQLTIPAVFNEVHVHMR